MKQQLLKKIEEKSITVGVVGLGYVGLPLAVEKAKAGFKTIGFDVQDEKVKLFPLLEKQRVPLHTRQFEESVRKAFFKSILNNVSIDEVLPESRIQTSPERKQRSIFELFSVIPFNLLQGFQFRLPYGTGKPVH